MSSKIPQVLTPDPKFQQYQQNVSKALELVLKNPLNFGTILTNVQLVGNIANNVPHKLNRKLQGWFIVRQKVDNPNLPSPAIVGIQDNQDVNRTPTQTLLLYASENVIVDIAVF